jgi:hypothetical protein
MEPHTRFSEEYRSLVERFVRPLRPEDGVSESTIVAGEKRLGLALPPILREFYLLAGRLKRINRAQELLLPPDNPNRQPRNYDELRELSRLAGQPEPRLPSDNSIPLPRSYDELTVARDGLAVYIENQGGCLWGIECASLTMPDPPVAIALDIDQPDWEPSTTICRDSWSPCSTIRRRIWGYGMAV